jgi:hypothetical protein
MRCDLLDSMYSSSYLNVLPSQYVAPQRASAPSKPFSQSTSHIVVHNDVKDSEALSPTAQSELAPKQHHQHNLSHHSSDAQQTVNSLHGRHYQPSLRENIDVNAIATEYLEQQRGSEARRYVDALLHDIHKRRTQQRAVGGVQAVSTVKAPFTSLRLVTEPSATTARVLNHKHNALHLLGAQTSSVNHYGSAASIFGTLR